MNSKNITLPASKNEFAGKIGNEFVQKLLTWNQKHNTRKMPWKGEKDPYKIWLSEIILQQTRVEQGLKYYENFIRTFPDVQALAMAPDDQIFKLWEGLGYYSRCRNLITTAKYISKELNGVFPKSFDAVIKLKGVGSYTASAMVSFAYNLPYAVLDGNVFRVLSRIFDIETPIDSNAGKKYFSKIAQAILPTKYAGEYNQAIMDFGAVICKPYPDCESCFFTRHCKAYVHNKQNLLPVKEKKLKIKERWLNYFLVRYRDELLVRQRTAKDIWQRLFEFVLIETDKPCKQEKLQSLFEKQYGVRFYDSNFLYSAKQKLTHQLINFSFLEIKLKQKASIEGFLWVKMADLNRYALPKSLQELVASQPNDV